MQYTKVFDPAAVRRNLVISLIASAAITNSFIIFPGNNRAVVSNGVISAAAAAALAMALLVTWRQKLDGLHDRTYAAFTIFQKSTCSPHCLGLQYFLPRM